MLGEKMILTPFFVFSSKMSSNRKTAGHDPSLKTPREPPRKQQAIALQSATGMLTIPRRFRGFGHVRENSPYNYVRVIYVSHA